MRLTCIFGIGWLLSLAAAGEARAQSCWPIRVLLEVRDSAGRRMDPAGLDSATYTVRDRAPRTMGLRGPNVRAGRDTTAALEWTGHGCHLRLQRVTLYEGGRVMNLDFDMDIDSARRLGPSAFVIRAPALEQATFRLRWDPSERGGSAEDPERLLGDRWERVAPD